MRVLQKHLTRKMLIFVHLWLRNKSKYTLFKTSHFIVTLCITDCLKPVNFVTHQGTFLEQADILVLKTVVT